MRLLMFDCALGIQQAVAQGVPTAVAACMGEHDSAKRLACYDREVGRAADASRDSLRSAPVGARTAPQAAPERSPEQTFGMTPQLQQKESGARKSPTLDKLTAHIASIASKPRGEMIVTLDNGQVWEEAEVTSHLDLHPGDEVTLRKGMLGAFYMSSRQVRGLRVKRTQ
jgi:hypothetical protein